MEQDEPILVYATFPSRADAERIGGQLVDERLAACVNILPGMIAIYIWEGERQQAEECAMIIKSRAGLAERIIARVRSLHSYENPALIVLNVAGGARPFLEWILTETAAPKLSAP
ncbi:MAG: divalent-cation tolerance protein CutA [Hyphomicrobiaceae bacterium]